MIKLKDLLTEKIQSSKISDENGKKLLNTEYSAAFDLFKKGIFFYRGMNIFDGYFLETHPSKRERTSRDAKSNIYTVLLGYLPSWEGWPKRSHSLIMTNNKETANEFGVGIPYFVFPKNGAKIVVSKVDDILVQNTRSFPYMFKEFVIPIAAINNLYYLLSYKNTASIKSPVLYAKGYRNFINTLQKSLSVEKTIEMIKTTKKNIPFLSKFNYLINIPIKFIETLKLHGGDWEKFLSLILDPDKNGFKLMTIENFNPLKHKSEMWTDADCLLVNPWVFVKEKEK